MLKALLSRLVNFFSGPTGPPRADATRKPVAKEKPPLYPISVEGKWGLINAAGEVVIPPRYLSIGPFSEGLARVTVPGLTDEDRLFERTAGGFINEHGEFVIGPGSPPGFEFTERKDYSYGDFHDGLAKFWIGDATGYGGYIDRSGQLVIPPAFASADDFSEGLACVARRIESAPLPPFDPDDEASLAAFIDSVVEADSIRQSERHGFIDVDGKWVLSPFEDFISLGFSEGLCVIDVRDEDGDWQPCVVNRKGRVVIRRGIYSGISSFVNGIACVVKSEKVGAVDARGRIAIPIKYDRLWEFEVGSPTTAELNGKLLILDRNGNATQLISRMPAGTQIGRMRSGMASVEHEGKYGYIDGAGRLVIPLQFDRAEDFCGELAKVELDHCEGYIDRRGEFVWKSDHWNEPIRNAVTKPLSDYLPPGTIDALPLDYNRQGVKNAIVFAANESFDLLPPWLAKRFGNTPEAGEFDDPDVLNVDFYGGEFSWSFHAVDSRSDSAEGFLTFYASKNLRLLNERCRPTVLGILILNR